MIICVCQTVPRTLGKRVASQPQSANPSLALLPVAGAMRGLHSNGPCYVYTALSLARGADSTYNNVRESFSAGNTLCAVLCCSTNFGIQEWQYHVHVVTGTSLLLYSVSAEGGAIHSFQGDVCAVPVAS
jgi:hypothetical protein